MAQPPVPYKSQYWANVSTAASWLATYLQSHNHPASDDGLARVYYDCQMGAFRLRDYSGDAAWDTLVQEAFDAYISYYVAPNNGGVQGFRLFTDGPLEDVLRNTARKTTALSAINLMLTGAAGITNDDYSTAPYSRECAYALITHINAERAGVTLSLSQKSRRAQLYSWALGHLDTWGAGNTLMKPFMVGLTAKALTHYHQYVDADAAIATKLAAVEDYLWSSCWLAGSKAFKYADRSFTDANDPGWELTYANPQPDLNLLISPLYGWLWYRTGTQKYRDRHDLIFEGGVTGTQSNGSFGNSNNPLGKQINQQLYWGPLGIAWAESDPVTSGGGGGGGGGGSARSVLYFPYPTRSTGPGLTFAKTVDEQVWAGVDLTAALGAGVTVASAAASCAETPGGANADSLVGTPAVEGGTKVAVLCAGGTAAKSYVLKLVVTLTDGQKWVARITFTVAA